jgi:hypothetical protein
MPMRNTFKYYPEFLTNPMIGQMTEADVLQLQQDIVTGLAMKGGKDSKGSKRYRVRNKTARNCRRYRLRSDEKYT